jgi:hypothetical protein
MDNEQAVLDSIESNYGSGDTTKAPKAKVKAVPEAKQVQKTEPAVEKTETPVIETKVDEKKPVAEKAAEVKTETKTEVKAEEKKIETKDEYYDPLENKKPAAKKDIKVEAKSTSPSYTEDQLKDIQNLDTYKKEAELFKKIKETPLGQIMLEAQELGKNPIELIQELQYRDFKRMPESSLANEYFTKVERLSGDELTAALEEFESLDEGYFKNGEKRRFINSLESVQSQMASKYLDNMKSSSNEVTKIAEQFEKDVESVLKESYKGKKPYGIELSPEQYADFEDSVRNFTLRDENGNIDANKVAFSVFAEKHLRSMRKNDYNKGRSEGMEEVLLSVHNPDRNDQGMKNIPVKASEKTAADAIEERFGNKAPQQVL